MLWTGAPFPCGVTRVGRGRGVGVTEGGEGDGRPPAAVSVTPREPVARGATVSRSVETVSPVEPVARR